MSKLEKIGPATFIVSKERGMKVPGLLIATEPLIRSMDIERPLEQVRNVAHLPGIVGYSVAMPDIHWGYGFPIGGVAAMDAKEGVISPGGVGYDINCGVRLAIIPVPLRDLCPEMKKKLIEKIYEIVPSGVGRGQKGKKALTQKDYQTLVRQGARYSIELGYGFPQDLEHIESHGCIEGADLAAVSEHARDRGKDQLGTIGSGNHFVEIGEVQRILLADTASAWGVEEGMTYAMIHSGSRGFGHQVCQDTLNTFVKKGFHQGLPDRQLVAAPINSGDGQAYFAGMAAAANFAFNNRQQILHEVRQAFHDVCNVKMEDVRLIYDVCHNIAKFETHTIDGEQKKVCVHRKGATRAYGPGAEELMPLFKKTGQPVLVPGDMGRASYLLVGLGNPLTFCSSCHGAGRARSRVQSLKSWKGIDLIDHMKTKGVIVMATSNRTIAEEMPDAYKDVDAVVEAVEEAKLANRVACLRPHLVLKG
ncbi:RtcB family protein [Simkania sp.]|uniref:RtcB family protein n=1 Tax=Simkania sp. TaxID=34094 RepID=UPI003B528658